MRQDQTNKYYQLSFDFEYTSSDVVLVEENCHQTTNKDIKQVLVDNVFDLKTIRRERKIKYESELNRRILDTVRHIM